MDDIASLTYGDAWWGNFLLMSTLIVLIGVVGEGVAELTKLLDGNPSLKKFVEVSSVLILIIGIAGELWGEARTSSIGDQISGFLSVKAGAANDRAASAEKEAAESNERAKSLEKETEELRSKNLALEAEIDPRKVSDADIKSIVDGMKPFTGRELSVKSYLGDTEGHRLLFIISQILKQAGLKPTPGHWNFDEGPTVKLLLGMEIDAPPEQSDLADALQKAFSTTKLGIRTHWFPMAPGTPVILYIGVKPFKIPGLP